jgi:DNA-binding Lrp family transcriptional regulator
MPTAYILLNTEIGAKDQVLRTLREIEGVEEVHSLWGVYDILANISSQTIDELKLIVTERIEKIGKISSKLTMIVTESKPYSINEQALLETEPIQLMR